MTEPAITPYKMNLALTLKGLKQCQTHDDFVQAKRDFPEELLADSVFKRAAK